MRTFFDLPISILLNFLDFKEHGQTAAVSKALKNSCDDNNQWNSLLKPEFQNYTVTGEAKKTFLTNPAARAKHIYFDEAGKAYLNTIIENRIGIGGLTDVQIAHLRSLQVKKLIADGMLDIDKAILRSAPTEVAGLNPTQTEGIKAGLTRDQVEHPWYCDYHTQLIRGGAPYELIAGLSTEQIDGMIRGLTREQVNHPWYTKFHTKAIEAEIPYETIAGLSKEQVDGIHAGLTREQVNHSWYSDYHNVLITRGVPYELIAGLSIDQVSGIDAGLTREQVDHPWYSFTHTNAIRSGTPYEAIAGLKDIFEIIKVQDAHTRAMERASEGLSSEQASGIRVGLTREQVNHPWYTESHTVAIKYRIPYETIAALSKEQVDGICAGLTREQVNHPWYSSFHTDAIKAGIPYETIAGLSYEQIDGIREGLTREQVNHPWYTESHTLAIRYRVPYETIAGLSSQQVGGIRAGLTREQVNHPWYSSFHTYAIYDGIPYTSLVGISEEQLKSIHDSWTRIGYDYDCPAYADPYSSYLHKVARKVAAKAGVPYESIASLSSEQIFGIQAGLTPEQVNHAWYGKFHTKAIEAGIPYESIAGLTGLQVWEMLVFAHSTPTPRR